MRKYLSPTAYILPFIFLAPANAHASGNHPEAGACPEEKPFHAICTHSLHNLEGWYGKKCFSDKQSAQRDAEKHAEEYHQGNMRWTGINQLR